MIDRRRRERAPLDVFLNKYIGGIPYMAKARDISCDGLSLARLIEPQQNKTRVGLQFQLPGNDEIIYCEGEVVSAWAGARDDGMAIRFTRIAERHRRLIAGYVALHSAGLALAN